MLLLILRNVQARDTCPDSLFSVITGSLDQITKVSALFLFIYQLRSDSLYVNCGG